MLYLWVLFFAVVIASFFSSLHGFDNTIGYFLFGLEL